MRPTIDLESADFLCRYHERRPIGLLRSWLMGKRVAISNPARPPIRGGAHLPIPLADVIDVGAPGRGAGALLPRTSTDGPARQLNARPPLTQMFWPVTKSEPGPRRNRSAPTMSSGACSLAKIRCAARVGAISGCRLS